MDKEFKRSITTTLIILTGQYETMPLGVSKGCAVFDPGTDSRFQDVFRRADERMYDDKAAWYKTHEDRRKRKRQ